MMAVNNIRLDCIINGSPTGGQSESSHFFIACTEVNSFFCLKYFLKNYEEFKVFRLKLAYILIHNDFDRVQDSYEEQEF